MQARAEDADYRTSMPLTNTLLDIVQAARSAVDTHPNYALSPMNRKQVYKHFSEFAKPQARGWLAVITARYVLPVWQREQPDDLSALQAIEHGDRLLHGRGDINAAKEFAGSMWEALD